MRSLRRSSRLTAATRLAFPAALATAAGLAILVILAPAPAAVAILAAPAKATGPVLAASATAAVAFLATEEQPAAAQATDAVPSLPRALYVTACESCHGTDGRGNPRIDAPVLAGLSAAYLQRQIDGFRRGYRGRHPDDVEGLEMRPMVAGIADADLAAVTAWLAALPAPGPGSSEAAAGNETPPGDPARGQTLYVACAVCHGRSGEGNDALSAPRLAGQAGWYIARQLRKFVAGVRGSHPDDTSGASMRTSVAGLAPGDTADIAAWIETLRVN
jgi:cytochrome c553